ncbi:hypothetical protein ACJMK2_000158 [Sinanodonta woodiana]|uniref:Uncharacterized protein n=1 Tax=Sinanodonta woodiana TaxID=1069815 RepID=A0ABD3XNN8_SINWO
MNMFFYMDFSVEELRKKIILEPQWIIDALKSLITAETFIRQNPAITSKFREFVKTGKLTHELIDIIWSKENNPEFHDNKDHILRLMEQLNIIATPRIFSEEGQVTKASLCTAIFVVVSLLSALYSFGYT